MQQNVTFVETRSKQIAKEKNTEELETIAIYILVNAEKCKSYFAPIKKRN